MEKTKKSNKKKAAQAVTSLSENFKSIDQFGISMSLNIDGYELYRTHWGALVTVFLGIILLFYSYE